MKITIIIEDNGEVKVTKDEYVEEQKKPHVSSYARFFDETCAVWSKEPEMNLMFLKCQEQFANEKLRSKGYLFLNEVYEMLGMPRTKAGQIIGWIYDEKNPTGDNYVDFDIHAEHNAKFINGYDATVLLDFNVDGNIFDRI